jgi:hypothetical protein
MDREPGSHRFKIHSGLWPAYRDFRQRYKLVYPDIDRKKYVSLCHMINTTISDKIIKESMEFRMPYRLGILSIKKTKLKINVKNGKLEKNKMIVDWGKTWEYWNSEYPGKTRKEINAIPDKIAIYNMNEHTNGYIMGWYWDKGTCMVHNQTVYSFRPTKRNRLSLAEWIRSDQRYNDYYEKKKTWKQNQKRAFRQIENQ